jgi:hypothetical protein
VTNVNGCDLSTADDYTQSPGAAILKVNGQYKPACLKIGSGSGLSIKDDFALHPLRGGTVDANGNATPDAETIFPNVDSGNKLVQIYMPSAGTFGFYCANHPATEKGVVFATWNLAIESCEYYCNTVRFNCIGAYQQFNPSIYDRDCETICDPWPYTGWGNSSGFSAGCHLYYAEKAANDPAQFCHSAGLGTDKCGSPCENFCYAQSAMCGFTAYPNGLQDCLATCPSFIPLDQIAYDFLSPVSSGDSVACRMHYLDVAAMTIGGAAENCPHLAAVSDVCK